jgi:hypothetical protein
VTAGALPPGLSLNPATGLISGTPTSPVSNDRIQITVTDSTSGSPQTAVGAFTIAITGT